MFSIIQYIMTKTQSRKIILILLHHFCVAHCLINTRERADYFLHDFFTHGHCFILTVFKVFLRKFVETNIRIDFLKTNMIVTEIAPYFTALRFVTELRYSPWHTSYQNHLLLLALLKIFDQKHQIYCELDP